MLVTSDTRPLSAFPIPLCTESSTLYQHRKDPYSKKFRIAVPLSSTVSRRHLESNSELPIMMPTLKPLQVAGVTRCSANGSTADKRCLTTFSRNTFQNERLFVATLVVAKSLFFVAGVDVDVNSRRRQPRSFLDENRIAFSVPNRFPLFTEEMEK